MDSSGFVTKLRGNSPKVLGGTIIEILTERCINTLHAWPRFTLSEIPEVNDKHIHDIFPA